MMKGKSEVRYCQLLALLFFAAVTWAARCWCCAVLCPGWLAGGRGHVPEQCSVASRAVKGKVKGSVPRTWTRTRTSTTTTANLHHHAIPHTREEHTQ